MIIPDIPDVLGLMPVKPILDTKFKFRPGKTFMQKLAMSLASCSLKKEGKIGPVPRLKLAKKKLAPHH